MLVAAGRRAARRRDGVAAPSGSAAALAAAVARSAARAAGARRRAVSSRRSALQPEQLARRCVCDRRVEAGGRVGDEPRTGRAGGSYRKTNGCRTAGEKKSPALYPGRAQIAVLRWRGKWPKPPGVSRVRGPLVLRRRPKRPQPVSASWKTGHAGYWVRGEVQRGWVPECGLGQFTAQISKSGAVISELPGARSYRRERYAEAVRRGSRACYAGSPGYWGCRRRSSNGNCADRNSASTSVICRPSGRWKYCRGPRRICATPLEDDGSSRWRNH